MNTIKRNCRLFAVLVLLTCIPGAAIPVAAQGTNLGTIRGVITDPDGAVIPRAAVKVTDVATGIALDLTSGEKGEYEAAGLKFGAYEVTVIAQGFRKHVISVALNSSETVRADARLEVGQESETVDVVAEGSVIQNESPAISGSLTTRPIIELPRDSRDIYQFLYLNPNITNSAENTGFKFIGAQSYGAAFSVDSQRSNGAIFGEPSNSQPSLEAVGELTVLSNNFTAEYAGIANVRIDTKRGSEDYHGSLFYNNKNSALSAWSFGDKIDLANFEPSPTRPDFPKPYSNLNETGGSFGGPVPFAGDRTFFFTAYERRWNVAPVRFSSVNRLPGSTLLAGDFSQLPDANKPAVPAAVLDLLTPSEIDNNTILVGESRRFVTIPQRLLNPTVQQLVATYFPDTRGSTLDPLGRVQDFVQDLSGRTTRDLFTLRVDHDFSGDDKLFAVYNYQRAPARNGIFASGAFPAFGFREDDNTNHTLSVSYTKLFTPTIVNEVRGGFNNQNAFRHAPSTLREYLASIGFGEADIAAYGAVVGPDALDTFGPMAVTIGPYANIPNGGRSVNRDLDQKLITFGDSISVVTSRHTIRGGADFVRNHGFDGFVANRGNPRGLITYSGSNADPLARFLLGLAPNSVGYVAALRGPLDVTNWELGFFAQDEFRVHPNLTLNLGLRYEVITPFVDKNDLLVNFDPTFVDPTTGRKGRFIIPTEAVRDQIDPRIIGYGYTTAEELGISRGLVNADRNNFAPRLGFAWRPTHNDVFRGGYGVVYPTSAAQGIRDALASSPFNQGRTKRSFPDNPLGGWPGGLTPAGVTPLTGGLLNAIGETPAANVIPLDIQQPRIEQFNFTYEREVGWKTGVRISYLGTRLHNLIGGTDLNLLPPSDMPFGTSTGDGVTPCVPGEDCDLSPADIARRPFPELGSFLASYGNYGTGRTHALQIEVNRRLGSGLMFNASYTLLDQKGSGFDTGNSSLGGTVYNQFQADDDFGREAFVSRHRFVTWGILDLPFGSGKRFGNDWNPWVDHALGDWQLSWNMFAKSGTYFTPFWVCGNCDPIFPGNVGSEFLDAVGNFAVGTSFRPVVAGDPQLAGDDPEHTFFDSDAFLAPPVGANLLDDPGVARRNALIGPGTWAVNLGIHKTFDLTERVRFELGADLNNAFNHPLFSPSDQTFAYIGDFYLAVDPQTRQLLPIGNTPCEETGFEGPCVDRNRDFGKIRRSYSQEGIDNRRTIRLRLRLTF
jgi:hypothetical protein